MPPIEAESWFRFAEDDLAAAKLLLTDDLLPTRLACFHAQQAVEKALKAALVRIAVPFPRTHDLAVLLGLQPPEIQGRIDATDLVRLQQWAVEARYPADLPDAVPDEANEMVTTAERIVEDIRRVIKGGPPV